MPVEGQWRRVNAPLPKRDRRALLIVACAVVLATAGGIAAYLTRPATSNAGCVVVTVPSTMGGAVLRSCGAAARTFCRDRSNLARAAEQCSRLGYATRASR